MVWLDHSIEARLHTNENGLQQTCILVCFKISLLFNFKDFSTITMQIIETLLNMVGTLFFNTRHIRHIITSRWSSVCHQRQRDAVCLIYVKVIPLSEEVLCPWLFLTLSSHYIQGSWIWLNAVCHFKKKTLDLQDWHCYHSPSLTLCTAPGHVCPMIFSLREKSLQSITVAFRRCQAFLGLLVEAIHQVKTIQQFIHLKTHNYICTHIKHLHNWLWK